MCRISRVCVCIEAGYRALTGAILCVNGEMKVILKQVFKVVSCRGSVRESACSWVNLMVAGSVRARKWERIREY